MAGTAAAEAPRFGELRERLEFLLRCLFDGAASLVWPRCTHLHPPVHLGARWGPSVRRPAGGGARRGDPSSARPRHGTTFFQPPTAVTTCSDLHRDHTRVFTSGTEPEWPNAPIATAKRGQAPFPTSHDFFWASLAGTTPMWAGITGQVLSICHRHFSPNALSKGGGPAAFDNVARCFLPARGQLLADEPGGGRLAGWPPPGQWAAIPSSFLADLCRPRGAANRWRRALACKPFGLKRRGAWGVGWRAPTMAHRFQDKRRRAYGQVNRSAPQNFRVPFRPCPPSNGGLMIEGGGCGQIDFRAAAGGRDRTFSGQQFRPRMRKPPNAPLAGITQAVVLLRVFRLLVGKEVPLKRPGLLQARLQLKSCPARLPCLHPGPEGPLGGVAGQRSENLPGGFAKTALFLSAPGRVEWAAAQGPNE